MKSQLRAVPLVACLAIASVGCPASWPATDSDTEKTLGSLPVTAVVSSVADAVVGPEVTSELAKEKLKVKAVTISLQIEDETAGSAQVAVLATAEGTISRATAKQLTLKFSVPENRTLLNQGFSTMMVDSKARELLNNTDLVAAIRGGAEGVRAGQKMIDLTDSEIEYEVDFVLTRSLSGGVDIKVWGVVGVTASATWTRKNTNSVVVTLEGMK